MELPRQYSYNPRWGVILGCTVFFGACSAFMANEAMHNKAGLILENAIQLGPEGATKFYWVIAALGGMFVLVAFLLTLRRILNPQVLELANDSILLPHGFFQTKTSRIRYADIQNVSEIQVSRQIFLYIYSGGRKFTITASLLPDGESYAAVKSFLESQTRH